MPLQNSVNGLHPIQNQDRFRDQAVFITGASRGLGRALALEMGRAGAQLFLTSGSAKGDLDLVIDAINSSGGYATGRIADLSVKQQCIAVATAAINILSSIDVFISNAGTTHEALLLRTSSDSWDQVMAVNLTGPAILAREIVPSLRSPGGQILFVSSRAATAGTIGLSAYSASKAGLLGLTRTLARELAPRGLRVNAVLPGYLATEMGLSANPDAIKKARMENLSGRISTTDQAASCIISILRQSYLNGQTINLDSRIQSRP